MDVKTAWGSKWIGAPSPDAALIASSRNATHNIAPSALHCTAQCSENSACWTVHCTKIAPRGTLKCRSCILNQDFSPLYTLPVAAIWMNSVPSGNYSAMVWLLSCSVLLLWLYHNYWNSICWKLLDYFLVTYWGLSCLRAMYCRAQCIWVTGHAAGARGLLAGWKASRRGK